MRVLITGVAGFIGSTLADYLIADGHFVVGIDNFATGRKQNINQTVEFIEGDIADGGIPTDLPPVDLVIHCAASYANPDDWLTDIATNVCGTCNAIEVARDCGARLFYFQTSLCYGNAPFDGKIPVHADLDPESSYAISKTAGESYIRHSGVSYVSFRLANIYGPRNLSGPIPTFYRRLSNGEPCTVVDSRRDFVYIDDLVDLVMRVMDSDYVGVLHAASGRDYSISDLYYEVAESFPVYPAPTFVKRGSDDAATILLDPSETHERFGWQASTPLAMGIGEACAWYAQNPPETSYTHLALKG